MYILLIFLIKILGQVSNFYTVG